MKRKKEIKHYSTNDKIEILGHVFNGLEDIDNSVEVETRLSNSIGERYICQITPKTPVPGIHVLKIYQPYPCFDSSDFMYENRRYCNYFFSKEKFTEEIINTIADSYWFDNYCLVHQDMDEKFTPAVYYGGSSWNDLIVAL